MLTLKYYCPSIEIGDGELSSQVAIGTNLSPYIDKIARTIGTRFLLKYEKT